MSTAIETLEGLFISRRHYVDDYRAYDHDLIYQMSAKLFQVFREMYISDLETGKLVIRPEFTEEAAQSLIGQIQEIEEKLVPEHDPDEDKIYLWDAENMPWETMTREEFEEVSFNPPSFVPHVIKFLQDDGQKHPAIILGSGNCRWADDVYPAAEFYQAHGYNAFVLANRHASGEKIRASLIRSLDLQRAIRVIRSRADELGVDADKIATNGFSMGNRATIDLINRVGIETSPADHDSDYRPDAVDEIPAKINAYISVFPAAFPRDVPSNYADFPQTFAVFGGADFSLWRMMPFFSDLIAHEVPVELHLFDAVDHGFTIANFAPPVMFPGADVYKRKANTQGLSYWPDLLLAWMKNVL